MAMSTQPRQAASIPLSQTRSNPLRRAKSFLSQPAGWMLLSLAMNFSRRTVCSTAAALTTGAALPTTPHSYDPPLWAKKALLNPPKSGRLHLANLPTPLYKLPHTTSLSTSSILDQLKEWDISLYMKRDDMTGGVELGGNKIRKLEFLLAHALTHNHDAVVTIGGEQSNHCRATAAACRMLGLEPHLILRTKRADSIDKETNNFGYTGNILFDRMVGSRIYTCTPGEYGRVGSDALVERLCNHLKAKEKKSPYAVPVGGSNGLGSWGYINGVHELMTQWNAMEPSDSGKSPSLDHVVFACGSGGTATGIAMGLALFHQDTTQTPPTVHAVGVCDDPDYFYDYVSEIATEMGFQSDSVEDYVRQHMIVHQGKGLGYASSTQEELDFCTNFALDTGIVLDPVYSGKAMYHFFTNVLQQDPESFRGANVLFWHTGGSLGMYDKGQDLLSTMDKVSPVQRLDVYNKNDSDEMLSV